MIECLACGHQNDPETHVCEACEAPLYSLAVIDPLATDTIVLEQVDVRHKERAEPGSEVFRRGMVLNIHIRGTDRVIRIRPNEAILFGRQDPTLRITPEVDLTDYGGARKGVSRVHAALRVRDEFIVLIDMASANGTYHNGERAPAHQPRLLRDGDELQLGQLVITIRFSD